MSDTNRVILTGRLTRDPELKSTASGVYYCRFTLANNYSVKEHGSWTTKANFFDVIAWGRQAEAIHKYVAKGQKILIDGVLRWSSWEHEGKKYTKVEIVAERFEFMSKASGPEQNQQGDPAVAAVFEGMDNDIPF